MFSSKTISKRNSKNKNLETNLNNPKKYKTNEIIDDIYNILYEKEFPSVLIISSKNFLKNIETQSEILIQKNLPPIEYDSISTQNLINKAKEKLLNKYNEEYSFLFENWNNYIEKSHDFLYLTHFRKHCNKCDKIAYHQCSSEKSGKLICIKLSHQILYYLCTSCKKCLRHNYLNLYCKNCDKEYFSSDKNIEENNESLYPATWAKYHCYILKDEIMRCLKCQEYLYLMKPENKLVCLDKKCNFSTKPEGILWNCTQCGVEFLSSAKIYEDDLVDIFKKEIKFTLLNKEIAKPNKSLFCCGKFLNSENFFHNINCNGILYKGKFNNKDIIVCGKCGYNNYLNDFIWTCPYCKKEIQSSSNMNSKNRSKNYSKDNSNDFKNNNNNNNQFQNIRVNRKLEKSLDIGKKVKFNEKTELEKKKSEFNKESPLKLDILNNISNINTCTSTNASTKLNNNKNCNNCIFSAYKKICSLPLKNKNSHCLNRTQYLQFKDSYLLNKTISCDEYNISNKVRNTIVYSTFEKRNKMFKIKNRINSNSANKLKNDDIINNKKYSNYNQKENIYTSRNEIYEYKSSKKLQPRNLQIDNENISNKLYFDSENKTKPENLTEVKNLKNFSNFTPNNPLLRNTICTSKKIFSKKCCQFDSMKNLRDNEKNNNIGITRFGSFIENRNNFYSKFKGSEKKFIKLHRSKRLNQNRYDTIKTTNSEKIINTENSISNFNNTSYKLNKTEDQIKTNLNGINKNLTSNSLISNMFNRTKILNIPKFKKTKTKNSNEFIPNKNNKNSDEMIIEDIDKYFNEKLSESIEKNKIKNYKKIKPLNCKKFNKNKLDDNSKQIKVKNIINNMSNRICYQKKLNSLKTLQNINSNSKNKTITNINNNNNKTISYIKVNSNKNINPAFAKKNKNDILKIGLLNHKNLITSPDKLNDIIKNCTIPTFKDTDFVYIEPIGEGSYGTIFLVKELKTKNEYALKKITCNNLNDIIKIKSQLELHYSLKHNNIMQIYKLQFKCLDFTTYGINVLMERASFDWGIEISKHIEKKNYYTQKELINIAKQIIDALQYLQIKKIAHRDIKPENILIYPNNIYKVADLGEAKNANNIKSKLYSLRGSEKYLSPALLDGLKKNKNGVIHNVYKSDVFSLGYCFLYAMSLDINILDKIRVGESNNNKIQNYKTYYNFIDKNRYSEKFLQFIDKMVVDNETQRYDFIQLNKVLNDLE